MNQSRNKIAVFSLAYDPFLGGAEIAIQEIMKRIKDRSFVCFTYRFKDEWRESEVIHDVEVIRVGNPGGLYAKTWHKLGYVLSAWRRAEEYHKREPFQVIWAIMASYAGIAALLFKLRHPSVPYLLTLQEGDSEAHILSRVGIFYPLWRLIFRKADYIQVISTYLKEFAVRHGATCSIEVIPNGVDIEKFQISNFKFQENLKPKNKDVKTIITTSRLVYKNGIDLLLRAGAELIKLHNSNFIIQILGDGPLERELKNLAKELEITDRVQFFGHVSPEDIPKYLALADIFVRPSRSEGLGSSFLEAMAAGVPIIGTPVGGILDFLKNEETGLFITIDDPNDLAKKIERLLNDYHLNNLLIFNGKALIQEHYLWDDIAGKVDVLLTKINLRRKIIIVSGIIPPEVGGPAYYADGLQKAFIQRGHKVKLVGYGWLKILPTAIRHIAFALKFLFFLITHRPSFVIALDTFSVGFPAVLMGKFVGVPIIIRTGGDFLWEFYVERTQEKILFSQFYSQSRAFTKKEKLIFRITRWTLSRARLVVFSSVYQCDIFLSAYRLEIGKTAIIENQYIEPKLAQNPAQKNFICFTRQLAWKNIDVLKRAFEKAKIEKPDISLEVGILSRDKYLEKLMSCYAVILVSLGDISPNMILEAIAHGKPFILTSENGLESRIHGIGLRVDPLEESAIAEKIIYLADGNNYEKEQKKILVFSYQHSYSDIAKEFLSIIQNI